MIPRDIAPKVLQYSRQYPVVTITGPRQSGKTTLCRMLFPDKAYVSLENIEERRFAETDPNGFLARFPAGAVLDEIQRAPDLLSFIQGIVDERQTPGMFVVTGSHNFALLASVSQSLAGRTALATLLPFSLAEIRKVRGLSLLDDVLLTGGFPRIYDQELPPGEAMAFYVATYVERDLRMLVNIKELSRFEAFLKLAAGRTGQVVNLSSLGNDCGVNHNTIKNWLSILEASYLVKLVPPYYRNFNKRLIKAPKLYFLDTGLAAFLLGIQDTRQLGSHPLRGLLFESLVVAEMLKKRFNAGQPDNLYFFRDSKGNEVDLVLDHGQEIDLIEVKGAQTVASDLFKGLRFLEGLSGRARRSCLVYGGSGHRVQEGVEVVGWQALADFEA
ncbi:MAG: ATP-binding protein [Thermodesulfobacteriota bacterium]